MSTPRSSSPLHVVLRANGLFSLAAGAVTLVAASWVSHALGIDHVMLTRMLGAGLLAFGVDVLVVSRATGARLRREALLISVADLAWVAATAAVVVSGALSTTGNLVAVAQGLVVADFAAAQLWYRSKATTPLTGATIAA